MSEEQELQGQGEPCWPWLWPRISDRGHVKMEQGCESSHCISLTPSVYVCVKSMGKLNGGGPSYQLQGFSRFMCVPPPQRFDCQWAAGGILWVEASETAKHPQCTGQPPCCREKSADTECSGLSDCTLPWREILVGKDGKCDEPNETISTSLTFPLHFHKTHYTLWDIYTQHAEGA